MERLHDVVWIGQRNRSGDKGTCERPTGDAHVSRGVQKEDVHETNSETNSHVVAVNDTHPAQVSHPLKYETMGFESDMIVSSAQNFSNQRGARRTAQSGWCGGLRISNGSGKGVAESKKKNAAHSGKDRCEMVLTTAMREMEKVFSVRDLDQCDNEDQLLTS